LPRSLASQLLQSLIDRTKAFRGHLESIRAENSGAPASFQNSLTLVDRYTHLLVDHTHRLWAESRADFDRINTVKSSLLDLSNKEETVDRIYARAGNASLPRSLAARVSQEFRHLRLPANLHPVLTVGAPGNFETHVVDFRGFLFHNLWSIDYPSDPAYIEGNFALITVPYLEGTRALWEPLVLGHEVGHVKIHYEARLSNIGVTNVGVMRNSYLEAIASTLPIPTALDTVLSWAQEILCDLNMIRLYGPAGIAALGEMLAVSDRPSPETLETHPPRSLRLSILLKALEAKSPMPIMTGLLMPWRELASEVRGDDPLVQLYCDLFLDNWGVLWNAIEGWSEGEDYEYPARTSEVNWLARRLARGVPGGLVEEHGGRGLLHAEQFFPADVVNAAWLSEEFVTMSSRRAEEKEGLLGATDRLAIKALDSLDFASLWCSSEGAIEREAYRRGAAPISSGVLSGADICTRLSSDGPDQLIVTPLLAGSLGDAGLDIRLSSSFIVSRHSATAVFDPINVNKKLGLGAFEPDPRDIQEVVEKDWGERFILHPGELVLAATLEYVVLPMDLVAQLVTRSSYGRLGLITATAIQVQPGSSGVITLELVNLSQTPVALRAGQRIGQLVFEKLERPSTYPSSRTYRWPTGPQFSRAQFDWDNKIIRGIHERDI